MALTLDEIKAALDLPTAAVPVDEWKPGESLTIRGLSAKDWDDYEQEILNLQRRGGTNIKTVRVLLVVKSVMNGDGKPLFSKDDLGWLQEKSAIVINRLYAKARELSGIGAEEAKELEKNSDAGRSDDSLST